MASIDRVANRIDAGERKAEARKEKSYSSSADEQIVTDSVVQKTSPDISDLSSANALLENLQGRLSKERSLAEAAQGAGLTEERVRALLEEE